MSLRAVGRSLALAACLGLSITGLALGAAGDGEETMPVTYNIDAVYRGDERARVTGGSKHVQQADMIGEKYRFEMKLAKIDVRDTNDDGYHDYRDIEKGDNIFIKTDLPKNRPGDGPFPVRFVVDKDHPRPRVH